MTSISTAITSVEAELATVQSDLLSKTEDSGDHEDDDSDDHEEEDSEDHKDYGSGDH